MAFDYAELVKQYKSGSLKPKATQPDIAEAPPSTKSGVFSRIAERDAEERKKTLGERMKESWIGRVQEYNPITAMTAGVASLARDAAKPIVSTVVQAPRAFVSGLAGLGEAAGIEGASELKEAATKPINVPGIGEVKAWSAVPSDIGRFQAQTPGESLAQAAEMGASLVGAKGASSVAKTSVKGLVRQAAKQGAIEGAAAGGLSGFASGVKEEDATLSDVAMSVAGGALSGAAIGGVTGAAGGKLLGRSLKKQPSSVDELIEAADKASRAAKGKNAVMQGSRASENALIVAKAEAPTVSIREKWAGVRPDIKKQISGKQGQLKSYFNVAHARNLDATLPTPLEVAKNRAVEATEKAKTILEDTGGKIGKFREKIKTYKIPADTAQSIIGDFDDELAKLNLRVHNRQVSRVPGTVSKVSDSEIKLLNNLRENLNVIRQTPTVDSVLQNRFTLDKKINFAKSAKEASSAIDPIARRMRAKLADVNRKVIGKSESKILEEYSHLAQFVDELDEYMGRDAGGEYLLKRVLSERGGDTRALFDTLQKYTNINLLDDAVMAQLATDLIGNVDQKGLFRKEITKAGLDAAAFLKGDKLGAAAALLDWGVGKIAEPEKMFLKAAR